MLLLPLLSILFIMLLTLSELNIPWVVGKVFLCRFYKEEFLMHYDWNHFTEDKYIYS